MHHRNNGRDEMNFEVWRKVPGGAAVFAAFYFRSDAEEYANSRPAQQGISYEVKKVTKGYKRQ
tara:strand:+ start:467 stop:655 length:189 start_codon:yes stop_codon:yes gene_type:complete